MNGLWKLITIARMGSYFNTILKQPVYLLLMAPLVQTLKFMNPCYRILFPGLNPDLSEENGNFAIEFNGAKVSL